MACRAAAARYRQTLRRRQACGLPILGARVSAAETWRRIGLLKREGFSQAEIARRLGYRSGALKLDRDVITVRNAIRVLELYRQQTAIELRALRVAGQSAA